MSEEILTLKEYIPTRPPRETVKEMRDKCGCSISMAKAEVNRQYKAAKIEGLQEALVAYEAEPARHGAEFLALILKEILIIL